MDVKLFVFFFRDEIASCMEKAYEKIAFSEAARMLFFESQKPMKQYAANVSQRHRLYIISCFIQLLFVQGYSWFIQNKGLFH